MNPVQHSDLYTQVERINHFLADLDPEVPRLSDVLRKAGVSSEAINGLRKNYLAPYVEQLCHRWQSYLSSELPERHTLIVIRRYSLNGEAQPTLAELGDEYGISRERVRQIEKAGIQRLHSRRRREALHHLAVQIAYEVAGIVPAGWSDPDTTV